MIPSDLNRILESFSQHSPILIDMKRVCFKGEKMMQFTKIVSKHSHVYVALLHSQQRKVYR